MKKITVLFSTAIVTIGTIAATLLMPTVVCADMTDADDRISELSMEEEGSFYDYGEFAGSYELEEPGGSVHTKAYDSGFAGGDRYLGNYACGRAFVEITKAGEGYCVSINWGGSAWEVSEWSYGCYYDNASKTLIANGNGTKADITFKEDGEIDDVDVEYTNGSAQFLLVDGNLIWEDLAGNAGDDMVFERV